MRVLTSLITVLFPLTTVAEPMDYRIDFEALFEHHAERVIKESGANWSLQMPGEVVLRRRLHEGSYRYSGADKSEAGSVGCLMLIVSELEAYRRECPAIVNAVQAANMDSAYERITVFAAENTYPPAPLAEYRAAFEAGIASKQGRISFTEAENCTSQEDILSFIGHLYGDNFEALFENTLAVPRLPVITPCL